uniref:Methyltransf_21 domain-containing protein n=1 Tax=Caenorhabditis tropicalis TaxID=1561998 RepID=A0A1I7U2F9_9PELO
MREISSIRRSPLVPFLLGCLLFFTLNTIWNRKNQYESPSPNIRIEDDVVVKKTKAPPQKEVWDTLDGIGYKFAKEKEVKMDPRFEKLNKLPACDLSVDKVPSKIDIPKLMDSFQKCITPIVEKWRDDVKAKEENVMLTLGIGHDTMAEEKLNRTLPNTKFYGADPIIEPNRQLYTAFGKYFPFAIGKNPGFTKFRVLPNQNQKTRKYEFQDVTTIPFTYFLSDILGLKQSILRGSISKAANSSFSIKFIEMD